MGNLFGVKDLNPDELRSCVFYKFAYAGCKYLIKYEQNNKYRAAKHPWQEASP